MPIGVKKRREVITAWKTCRRPTMRGIARQVGGISHVSVRSIIICGRS